MRCPPAPDALLYKARALLAAQAQGSDAPLPSPCIAVCRMDAARHYCLGCLRTLDEIVQWGQAGPDERQQIWQAVLVRTGLQTLPPA